MLSSCPTAAVGQTILVSTLYGAALNPPPPPPPMTTMGPVVELITDMPAVPLQQARWLPSGHVIPAIGAAIGSSDGAIGSYAGTYGAGQLATIALPGAIIFMPTTLSGKVYRDAAGMPQMSIPAGDITNWMGVASALGLAVNVGQQEEA